MAKYRREANNVNAEHPDGTYIAISLALAKQELEYLKDDLKDWETAKKFESEGINIVHATILVPCKQELGRTEELGLKEVWERLKDFYTEVLVGMWNKELKKLFALKGQRKSGQDPSDWLRSLLITGKSITDNLGELTMNILLAHLMIMEVGKDLQNTVTDIGRMSEWLTPEIVRKNLEDEYVSKSNTLPVKAKLTA